MAVEVGRRRSIKPPGERRRDLLDAAIRVFARRGVEAATVSEITQEAGVAKGTFYLSFDSKDRLLGELKARFADEIVDRAAEVLTRTEVEDWWQAVDATIETMTDFMLERRDLIQVFSHEAETAGTTEIFGTCVSRLIEMLTNGIRAGAAAGAFHVEDPEMTAALLHHAVDGTLQHAILYEREVDRDRLVEASRTLARRALSP